MSKSDPAVLANAPPWVASILERFDEAMQLNRENGEQAHRAANKIANAFLKTEAAVALSKTETEGCRSDIRSLRRHFDESLLHFEERFAALEERIAALEAKHGQ